MTRYRQVLAVPGMAPLLGISLLARAAITADVMALTMYVVLGLHMSYAAAGGIVAAMTAGMALGGQLLGRMIDRRGPRIVLLVTVGLQAAFWLSVPILPYGILLGAAFTAGLLMVPAQLVTRQAIAAMTTAAQRQAAFALESVQGELSYVVGPPIVLFCAAKMSPGVVAWGVGAAIVAGGAGIARLNPPLRAVGELDAGPAGRPRRRDWLGPGMIATLVMAFGATMLLSGTDLAIVGTLKAAGQVSWAAVVVAVYGVASIAGGLVYGALSRPRPTWLLLGLLGLATLPAGLAHDWRWLCVAGVGAGLLAAPTLSTVADAVSRLAPAGVRGEATGLQSSALSAGFALGSPIVGTAIDLSAPAGGFAAAGLAGLVAALTGCLLSRRAARAERRGVIEQAFPESQEPIPRAASACQGGNTTVRSDKRALSERTVVSQRAYAGRRRGSGSQPPGAKEQTGRSIQSGRQVIIETAEVCATFTRTEFAIGCPRRIPGQSPRRGSMPVVPSTLSMQKMAGMAQHASGWDTAGAILLLLWAVGMWAAVGGLWYANKGTARPWVFRASATVIVIGIIGQIGHLTEHVAQVGYWFQHPNSPAWMTPWGTALARGFGQVDTSKPTLGMEILHLTGNFIFLAGLAAVMVITHRARRGRARFWGKMGVWMQGIHGLEHLTLTLSVWFGAKQAIGLSTWFGQLTPGPGLTTYRIWWHFIANVIGSIIFGVALYYLWRERHDIRGGYDPAGRPSERGAAEPVGATAA